jgi:hypothetical protein
MANAYSPAVAITGGQQNSVPLDVTFLTVEMSIANTDITASGTASDFDDTTIAGYTALRLPTSKISTDTMLYPSINVTGLSPLYEAWGANAPTLAGGWILGASRAWFEALGTTAERDWKWKDNSGDETSTTRMRRFDFTTLKVKNGDTSTSTTATFVFSFPGDLKVNKAGGGGNRSWGYVLNTFGRLYGTVFLKPFGTNCQGVIWSIQGGTKNYYLLSHLASTDPIQHGAFGGLVVAFGGEDTPGDETGLPLSDFDDVDDAEQTAISIILTGQL